MKKRLIALLLVMTMVVSMLPVSVFASTAETNAAQIYDSSSGSNVVYATLEAAIDAAEDGETITLLSNVESADVIWIKKSITLNLNGHTVTGTGSRLFRVLNEGTDTITVTIKNGAIVNNCAGGRCIETRSGNVTLNLTNVNLKTEKGNYDQVLTVGGSGDNITVNITNSTLEAGCHYAVVTFNPVKMVITGSEITGYAALYMKGKDGSLGSAGSIVEIVNSTLTGVRAEIYHESNTFGTIVLEDGNIAISISDNSVVCTAGETEGDTQNVQAAILVEEDAGASVVEVDATSKLVVSEETDEMVVTGDGSSVEVDVDENNPYMTVDPETGDISVATINYVSLGDSMTNGYGLTGYEYHRAANGYLQVAPESYPARFAAWLAGFNGTIKNGQTKYIGEDGVVNLTQLAMSGMRPEDALFALSYDWENADHSFEPTEDDFYALGVGDYHTLDEFFNNKFRNNMGSWRRYTLSYYCTACKQTFKGIWEGNADNDVVVKINDICKHVEGHSDAVEDADVLNWHYVGKNVEILSGDERAVEYKYIIPYESANVGNQNGNVWYGNGVAATAAQYQNAIKEADVISICLGNANFGVVMLSRLLSANGVLPGFGAADYCGACYDTNCGNHTADGHWVFDISNYRYEDLKATITDPAILEVAVAAENLILDYMGIDGYEETKEYATANLILYTTVSYALSYRAMLDRIAELNPDAEIIIVGNMNAMSGIEMVMADGEVLDLQESMEGIFGLLNDYLAGLATLLNETDSNHKDITYYYAEEPTVDVLVNHFAEEIDKDNVLRDRFIEEYLNRIVLMMANKMVSLGLDPTLKITRADVENFIDYYEGEAELNISYDKAYQCAIYYGFERAIIAGGESGMLYESAFESTAEGFGAAFEPINAVLDGTLGAVFTHAGTAAMNFRNNLPATEESGYLQQTFDATVSNIQTDMPAYASLATIITHYCFVNSKTQADMATLTVAEVMGWITANYENDESTATDNVLVAVSDGLNNAMSDPDDELFPTLLSMFGRMIVGTGVGQHPSAEGHEELTAAVIKSYSEGYTAGQETDKNLQQLVCEAYKVVYAKLAESGYLTNAQDALAQAEAVLPGIMDYVFNLSVDSRLEGTKNALYNELSQISDDVTALNELLNSAEMTEDDFCALVVLMNSIEEHKANIEALATELGILGELTLEQLEVVQNHVADLAETLADDAYAWMLATDAEFGAAYMTFVNDVYNTVYEVSPELADVVKAYLIDTPAEAMEIILTAGEDAVNELVTAAVSLSGDIETIITGLFAVLNSDVNALIEALDDARVEAVNAEIAIAKAKIEQLKQDIINAPTDTIANYEAMLAQAEEDFVELQSRLVATILTVIEEKVDPATAAMVGKIFDALEDAVIVATAAGEKYGMWFAGRFDQMAGELLALIIENTKNYGVQAGFVIDEMIWEFINNAKEEAEEKVDEYLGQLEIEIDLSEIKAVIADLRNNAAEIRTQIAVAKKYTSDNLDKEIVALEDALSAVENYADKLEKFVSDIEALVNGIDATELTLESVKQIVAQAQVLAADAQTLVEEAKASLDTLVEIYEAVMPQIIELLEYVEEGSPVDGVINTADDKIGTFIAVTEQGYADTVAKLESATANIEIIVNETLVIVSDAVAEAIDEIIVATEIATTDIYGAAEEAIAAIKAEAQMLAQSTDAEIREAGEQILALIAELELSYTEAALIEKYAEIEAIIVDVVAALENVKTAEDAEAVLGKAAAALEALAPIAEELLAIAEQDVVVLLGETETLAMGVKAIVESAAGNIGADAVDAYEASADAISTAVDTSIAAVNTAIAAYETAVVNAVNVIIPAVIEAAEAIGAEVTGVAEIAAQSVAASIERAKECEAIIEALEYAIYDTTHGEIIVDCDGKLNYASVGNADYLEALRAALLGNAVAEITKTEIQDADIITVKFDNGEFMTFAYEQIMGLIAQVINSEEKLVNLLNGQAGPQIEAMLAEYGIDRTATYTELDWGVFDADVITARDEVLVIVENILVEQGVPSDYPLDIGAMIQPILDEQFGAGLVTVDLILHIPMRELLVKIAENALYGYFEFASEFPVTLNTIRETAPNAHVVVTGIENNVVAYLPAFVTENFDISEYNEYIEYVVDALNMHLFAYAAINTNTTFVESGDVIGAIIVQTSEHTYEGVVTDPDCVNGGYTTYTCSVCGDSYVADEVAALGHSFTNYVSNGDATCTEDGTKTAKCDRCDVTDTVADAGSQLDHSYVNGKCSVCGAKDPNYNPGIVVPPVHIHTPEVVPAVEPTCTETGLTEGEKCATCGAILVAQEEVAALGHTEGETVVENNVEPTCTEAGSYDNVVYCTICGEELSRETVTVEALGHKYESVVTAPTCAAKGYTTHTCSVCGDSYTDSATNKREHDWDDGVLIQEPGCETLGVKLISCKYDDCDACFEDKLVPATGHSYGEWTVTTEATCTKVGVESRTCATCGEVETREIPATGVHTYGEWVVTKEATVEAEGEETRTCSGCGATETRAIEKLEAPVEEKNNLWWILLIIAGVGGTGTGGYFFLKKKKIF